MLERDWEEDLKFNLKALINESGLSVRELSKETGLSVGNISRYMNGQCIPTFKSVIKLSHALNCELSDIAEIYEEFE